MSGWPSGPTKATIIYGPSNVVEKINMATPRKGSMTESIRLEILRDYAAGISVSEIGRKYGVSSSYTCMLASRRGVARRTDPAARAAMAASKASRKAERERAKLAEIEAAVPVLAKAISVAEIRSLSRKGVGITAIAALLKCPYRDIYAALER